MKCLSIVKQPWVKPSCVICRCFSISPLVRVEVCFIDCFFAAPVLPGRILRGASIWYMPQCLSLVWCLVQPQNWFRNVCWSHQSCSFWLCWVCCFASCSRGSRAYARCLCKNFSRPAQQAMVDLLMFLHMISHIVLAVLSTSCVLFLQYCPLVVSVARCKRRWCNIGACESGHVRVAPTSF